MTAFVLLSYAGYLTFVLMPTAPPWLASQMRALDTVYLVQKDVPFFQRLFEGASANPMAAWPSLHAAVPWLMFLFALRVWGRKARFMALYPLAIWVNIVYLGHHYVVDAIGGVAYASAAFAIVELAPWRLLRERRVILTPWRPPLRGGLQALAQKPQTRVPREASGMVGNIPVRQRPPDGRQRDNSGPACSSSPRAAASARPHRVAPDRDARVRACGPAVRHQGRPRLLVALAHGRGDRPGRPAVR